jgi:hypothetical protein
VIALSRHRTRHELAPRLVTINAALTTEPLRFLSCGPTWRRMRNGHTLGGFRTLAAEVPFACSRVRLRAHRYQVYACILWCLEDLEVNL